MSENASSTELTPKQEILIQALIAGHTIQLSAKAAAINEKTAHRWLKLPHFKAAYKLAQKQVYDQAMTQLALKAEKWINRLDFHTESEDTPAAIQVQALKFLVEQASNRIEAQELEQRVIHLEERLSLYE